ncbi:hypothetical protein [Ammoniphilus sp. CFH 90114]|uniref:hypothetical protein n=1 Tax=Ammoniphilus sp. CFH 90114 TaxID=2493665 RepID=UPI00100FF9EA|nr:hypothetical protein [Ammoniphilus sp. CFH 90114]RXT13729.1 hypothetical protein EIZ39_06165 [Ammoniphilus sp. CFH 90114]
MVTATIVILLSLAIISAAIWFSGVFNNNGDNVIKPMRSDMQRLGADLRTEIAEEFHPDVNVEFGSESGTHGTTGSSPINSLGAQLNSMERTEMQLQADAYQALIQQLQATSSAFQQMNQSMQTIDVLLQMEHGLQQIQNQALQTELQRKLK